MKYTLLVLLFSFGYTFSKGQTVKFQLQRIRPCDNSQKVDSFDYYLINKKSDSIYSPPYKGATGIIDLPKIGKYYLNTFTIEPSANTEIEISDTGLFIYKIIEPKIILRTYNVLHPPQLYEICGRLADGYSEDFYSNGQLRIRGNFIKGKPKDSVINFYSNGSLQTKMFFWKKRVLFQEYDSLNHLLKIKDSKRVIDPYFTPWKDTRYEITEYFTTGKIKRSEIKDSGYITLFKEYYPSGSLKSELTKKEFNEFYKNGKRRIVCTWEREKNRDWSTFTITKVEFNKSGNIIEKQIFTTWGSYDPEFEHQPETEILRSDSIVEWTKFQKGKIVTLAKNISTKDYIQLHPN